MNLLKKLSSITQSKVSTPHKLTNRGFTLIELLVVVAILAVLVSIGAASYRAAQRNARDQTRTRDLNQVKIALEQHFEINLAYPVSNAGQIDCSGAILWGTEWDCGGHTYMHALPKDPTTGQTYCYKNLLGDIYTFELFAKMENSNNGNIPSADGACGGKNDYDYKLESEK